MEATLGKIEQARELAIASHKDQKYGENLPYAYHLAMVYEVLTDFGCENEHILTAAWLHDIVEDTPVTIEEIGKDFGKEVEDLVWRVTNEPGKNRKERHVKTYEKMRARPNENAMILKLADRIANLEASLQMLDTKKCGMYVKEYDGFKQGLILPNTQQSSLEKDMWAYLDKCISEAQEIIAKTPKNPPK